MVARFNIELTELNFSSCSAHLAIRFYFNTKFISQIFLFLLSHENKFYICKYYFNFSNFSQICWIFSRFQLYGIVFPAMFWYSGRISTKLEISVLKFSIFKERGRGFTIFRKQTQKIELTGFFPSRIQLKVRNKNKLNGISNLKLKKVTQSNN